MTKSAPLDSLLNGLNSALRNCISPGTGLFDPVDNKPSPPDHYGHVSAALALACAGERDWEVGRQALSAWLALDQRELGHAPFNRLALLLLRVVLATRGLTTGDNTLIEAGLRRCTLRRRYASNNWSLLAQTCRLIEIPARHKSREGRRLCKMLERWTTQKGCFIDFPENPGVQFSTPLAYHHKALFLAALACWFHDDTELARHAQRLCDWLVHCWDPTGYAGGFGRTTHGLFGDGCLIAGLILAGLDDSSDRAPIAALSRRLALQRRGDELLWLNPAGPESGSASWDDYMHLSVYNAWAAAVIGAARHIRGNLATSHAPPRCEWRAHAPGWFHDAEAGLACARTSSGLTAIISTHGQPPQSYGNEAVDFRYAGGLIFHLCRTEGSPLLPPPIRVQRAELEKHPELAGWSPLFNVAGEIYALTSFQRVAVKRADDCIEIELEGEALAAFCPPPSSVWQQLKDALDWRILGRRLGRTAVFRRRALPGLKGTMLIALSMNADPAVQLTLCIYADAGVDAIYLNPFGRARTNRGGASKEHGPVSTKSPSSLPEAQATCGLSTKLPVGFSQWTLNCTMTGLTERYDCEAHNAD